MKNLKDLFEHQIKDLFSAEKQLEYVFPQVLENVIDAELRDTIATHFEETKRQKQRLNEICSELCIQPSGVECNAMKGLIKETVHFLEGDTSQAVRDAGIIANCQRIEHYEISGYGTAVRLAKQLGHDKIAEKLQVTLNEEYSADETLDRLAERKINEKALG